MGKGPRYVTSYRKKYRRYVTPLLCNALLTTLLLSSCHISLSLSLSLLQFLQVYAGAEVEATSNPSVHQGLTNSNCHSLVC